MEVFAAPESLAILSPMIPANNFYRAVYRLVRAIPRGRVMTYGQVATILGAPRAARAVGYAMKACKPADRVPWQRVINAKGAISGRDDLERPFLQRQLLEEEGIVFRPDESCDLEVYRWSPRKPEKYHYVPLDDLPFEL